MAGRYNFSRDNGGRQVAFVVSEELHGKLTEFCRILEMTQSSLVRYLLTRGVNELESKLNELADKAEDAA